MKKVFRSQSEPLDYEKFRESNGKPSLTIPNQSMTQREILHRYTSGQALNVNVNEPVYLTNVPLYDTRRKHSIDIAVDKHNNERKIMQQQAEVFDGKTKIESILKSRKSNKQQPPAGKTTEITEPKPE